MRNGRPDRRGPATAVIAAGASAVSDETIPGLSSCGAGLRPLTVTVASLSTPWGCLSGRQTGGEGAGHPARHTGYPLRGASAPGKVPLRCPGWSCRVGQPVQSCLARQEMCLGMPCEPPFAHALLPLRPLPGAVTAVTLGSFRSPSWCLVLRLPSWSLPPPPTRARSRAPRHRGTESALTVLTWR